MSKCAFSGFLRDLLQSHGSREDEPTLDSDASPWPIPIPYPECFRRFDGVSKVPMHKKRLVSLQVALLDWLVLGCPAHAPRSICMGRRLKSCQWSVIQTLLHLSWDANSPDIVTAVMMGRGASKFETFEEEVASLHDHSSFLQADNAFSYQSLVRNSQDCMFSLEEDDAVLRSGTVMGYAKPMNTTAAKELIPDRLKFPSKPLFDPVPLFDKRTASVYEDPIGNGTKPEAYEGDPPKVQVRASRQNLLELYSKLRSSGRLEVVNKKLVRQGFLNGLFSVGKDAVKDRLILDGRPANCLEYKLDTWTSSMAAATCLADLHLQDNELLLCSGEDLRDFFYQFKVSDIRTGRNTLCEPLTKSEAEQVFGRPFFDHDEPIFCGLSSLAMGDTNACEFAQSSHVSMCLLHQVILPEELLHMRGQVPRTPFLGGIIIDDLVLLEKCLRSDLQLLQQGQPSEADNRLDKMLRCYTLRNLEHNPGKEFRNDSTARFWGAEIDGDAGIVRASSLRIWPLIQICCHVCEIGWCSVSLLEAIAGSWVSIFGLRKRLLCLMDVLFEALGIAEKGAVLKLSDDLLSELWSLILIGPLSGVNMRAHYAPFVTATDASMDWLAAVRSPLEASLVEEFSRKSLRRGAWSQLLPPAKRWLRCQGLLSVDDELPDDRYDTHPLWSLLARVLPYEERWRLHVEVPRHINILELKSFLREERLISYRGKHLRCLFGLDSQVCLGALCKGRASSSALNKELKRNVPHILGSDIYSFFMYFPSALNRADDPTRHAKPRAPDLDLPEWWDAALEGDFSAYDAWLAEVEKGVVESAFDLTVLQPSLVLSLHKDADRKRDFSLKAKAVKENKISVPDNTATGSDHGNDFSFCSPECIAILQNLPRKQFFFRKGVTQFTEPGALDLFSSSFGVARQMVKLGCPWVLTFEWRRGAEEDLLNESTRSAILCLIRGKVFKTVGAAIICCSFSIAVTPPVRSSDHPRGLPSLSRNMRKKVHDGNSHSDFLADIIKLCLSLDLLFWFENPDSSWLFRLPKFAAFRDPNSEDLLRLSFCRFGTPWRKTTRFGTNIPSLKGARILCSCKNKHLALRGYSKRHRKAWTSVAEPYPSGVSRLIAGACCVDAGWSKFKKLDVAACCRCSSLRIGEAKNPGPRRVAPRSTNDLEDIPLISAATAALEAKVLEKFISWVCCQVDASDVYKMFDLSPLLVCQMVCAYGRQSFADGGALSNFRHLVLAVQKWRPMCRPYMKEAWDLISRWEISEPTQHRPPVPEVVVLAMCTVAWQLSTEQAELEKFSNAAAKICFSLQTLVVKLRRLLS